MKCFIKLLKNIVNKYEMKHPEYIKPVYMCHDSKIRNRYKNDKYKIPEDKPQCPVFKDNRCCGNCRFADTCDHCVNCGCYGFTYAQMGGNDKNYFLHKASDYYGLGRLKKDGNFDWEYYKKSLKKKEIVPNKFIIIDNQIYEIKSKVKSNNKFLAMSYEDKKTQKFNINDLGNYVTVYDNIIQAELYK